MKKPPVVFQGPERDVLSFEDISGYSSLARVRSVLLRSIMGSAQTRKELRPLTQGAGFARAFTAR